MDLVIISHAFNIMWTEVCYDCREWAVATADEGPRHRQILTR